MSTGDVLEWNSVVDDGVKFGLARARADAGLLGCVYQLWCSECGRYDPNLAGRSTAEEFRLALQITPGEANTMVELAIGLHERMPLILGCMRDGLVDFWRAEQAHEVFGSLSVEDVAVADARVAERVRREGRPLVWRDYVRRVADRIDKRAKERRVAVARQNRYVSFQADGDGVGTMFGRLPVEDIARRETRIDGLARGLRAGGDSRNLEQLRADVTVGLILGTFEPKAPAGGFTVNVQIPLGVALHVSDQDCHVDGYGDIPAHVAQAMLNNPDNALRKVLLDPDDGVVVGLGRKRYRPNTRLQEFIHIRDQHCRVPGCHRPIREIDHICPWHPGGCTDPDNLQGLCSLHHKLKSDADWKHEHTRAGTIVTSPAGRTYHPPPPPGTETSLPSGP